MPVWLQTAALLCCSNLFMTFAWYGHLKSLNGKPWLIAALISWGIAFFEYMLMVPANRIGYTELSIGQLKIMQEVITLAIFVPFSVMYMQQPLKLDYLWAGLPMVVTEGDGFADLVTARDLGIVVPEGDVTALADALEIVLEDDDVATRFRRAVPAVAAEFAWPRALAPILAFVEDPVHARDYQPGRVGMSELGSVRRTAGVGHYLRMAWHHLTHAGPSGVLRRLRDRGRAS
jgi:uncharacterized protein (DUF486 family)